MSFGSSLIVAPVGHGSAWKPRVLDRLADRRAGWDGMLGCVDEEWGIEKLQIYFTKALLVHSMETKSN